MAFNFLDSQRQSAINFGSEINSVDDFEKQQTSNRLQELSNYNNNVNSVLSTVKNFNLTEQQSQFGLQEAYQAGQAALGEKKILDVEAIIGGAMPFVQTAKLLAKLPQAYYQLKAGASKFSDYLSQASSGEGSFIDTAGNAIKQNIGESISEFQGRLADAGAKFVSNVQQTGQNIVDVGQQAISDLRTPANALEELPQDVQARQALSSTETGESAGVEMSQINTTTISNPAFEGEVGELSTGSMPVARILPEQAPTEIASEVPSVAPAESVGAESVGEGIVGDIGAEVGGEAIAEAGALAIPGVGEILGAAGLVYGIFSGIKDSFESSSQAAPPPPPPIEVAPLEEAPSYYTTSQGVANINQSFQSGV